MLKVTNISKNYGKLRAVNNLSFSVEKGEIFALLGSNGAGKTTTFRIILSLLETDSGNVLLNDQPIDYKIMEKIGFVTEERSLLTKLTVKEQILFYGKLKGMSEKDILNKLEVLLEKFEISDYLDKKIKELSKGNQQKVQFISAVLNDPILLILDEPFTGLDPINVKLMKEYIYELKEKGCIIIFSSHQMEHIEEFCEKLILLVKGNVVLSGYLKDIKNSYEKKKVIIEGENINIDDIKNINGVLNIQIKDNKIIVKVETKDVIKDIFNHVKNYNISQFITEEMPLNDIFIEKVGESL